LRGLSVTPDVTRYIYRLLLSSTVIFWNKFWLMNLTSPNREQHEWKGLAVFSETGLAWGATLFVSNDSIELTRHPIKKKYSFSKLDIGQITYGFENLFYNRAIRIYHKIRSYPEYIVFGFRTEDTKPIYDLLNKFDYCCRI
jgi:hypothetical protein